MIEYTLIDETNSEFFEGYLPPTLRGNYSLAIGAMENGIPCALLAGSVEETTFIIRFIFVEEDKRKNGIGSGLIDELNYVLERNGFDLCEINYSDTNTELDEFLSKRGFLKEEQTSSLYTLKVSDVLKLVHSGAKVSDESITISPLEGAPSFVVTELITKIDKKREGDEEGLYPLIDLVRCDPKCSFLLMNDKEVGGCLLSSRYDDKCFIDYLCIFDQNSPLAIMGLIAEFTQKLREESGDDTTVYINALTDKMEKLVVKISEGNAKLIGKAVNAYHYY